MHANLSTGVVARRDSLDKHSIKLRKEMYQDRPAYTDFPHWFEYMMSAPDHPRAAPRRPKLPKLSTEGDIFLTYCFRCGCGRSSPLITTRAGGTHLTFT